MMRGLPLIAATIALAACATATGPGPRVGDSGECTWGNSRRVEITEITSHPERYHRTCVTVRGLLFAEPGDRIFTVSASQMAAYRSDEGIYWRSRGSRSISVIADEGVSQLPNHHYASVTGMVLVCKIVHTELDIEHAMTEAAMRAAGNEDTWVYLLDGMCGNSTDPYVYVRSSRSLPGEVPPRLLPHDRNSMTGNFLPAPREWRHRSRVEELARKFLNTLRNRDFAALAALHVEFTDHDWRNPAITSAGQLDGGPFAVFGRLMRTTHEPQILIVPWRWHNRPHNELDPQGDDYSSMVCYCLTDDCRKLWPIHYFDADNRQDRPYACLHIEQQRWSGETETRAGISIMPAALSGFAEPGADAAP